MYKNILFAVIIAIFAGCSAPKPQQAPSWFTNLPKDYKNFYAVAAASDETKAKSIAINELRKNIIKDLDASFSTPNHSLSPSSQMLNEIISANLHLANTLSMRAIKVEKTELFNGQILMLISIQREELFKKINSDLNTKIKRLGQFYSLNKDTIPIKRYVYLKPLMSQYAYLASRTAFAQISISTYNSNNNFRLLKELENEYNNLQTSINFYILSDGNSRVYTKTIKDAIEKDGLSVSNKSKDSHTLKLLISSSTDNTNEYTFNVSKNLVKFTTFDANKNQILFRQHTFIGKSRKNHQDAKEQTIEHINAKVKQLGIFDFIGIQSK
ncbi:hypothetical protein SMGD1_0832 [Sulfurimonas gotlandica GD1]|uniref:Lipoprotein n=1 Tax=Sulfurimonas gotlandica (strain DSM 19862 / JCM 16533 / GD1) TaxID=929558 RepID=B6BM63_SULGG|nr:hypothetical protein [Sulfurimonas gotlandica]EDZ61747.1 conserved hypothetical protein [Sulfurimonas gotlandica GD1]EHP29359.1 hypothetical protein SMGD1_0832 [Sulfurimonas gotlandica GD1]